MKTKILHLEVSDCSDCPYCEYNSHYEMNQKSGIDCYHPGLTKVKRIKDDKPTSRRNETKTIETTIPEWCPLENKDES